MPAGKYEEALARSMGRNTGEELFLYLALAECAGISSRAHAQLRHLADQEPERKFRFNYLMEKSLAEVTSFWKVLSNGSSREIFDAVRTSLQNPRELSDAVTSLVLSFVALERGSVLNDLYSENVDRLGGRLAEEASFNLAVSGDWDNALAILDRACRDGTGRTHFTSYTKDLIWKFAYLHSRVDDVLPRLAEIPINRKAPHAADARAWRLAAYQIRAGKSDIRVPVVESGAQSWSYLEAAAIWIATLADVPAAADSAAELRRSLRPQNLEIQHANTGFSYQMARLPYELFRAEARIAARGRDYAKLSALAQKEPPSLASAPDIVIDALIEEGDWRAAAHVASLHDVRDRDLIPGFDDTRVNEYAELQLIFAAAAARDGDDAAAEDFLSRHIEALAIIRDAYESDFDFGAPRAHDAPLGTWPAALLAGAAEGKLPRKLLSVLLPVFRN